jgi:phosphate transport system substrate-binding protein
MTIVVDETLYPLGKELVDVFNLTYPKAKITAIYRPEAEAFRLFLQDSVQLIVGARKLLPKEEAYFKEIEVRPRPAKVAYDALALILNKDNPDSVFTWAQTEGILGGKITNWNELPAKQDMPLQVVFDNAASSTVRQLTEMFVKGGKLPATYSALNDNPSVIKYVSEHKGSIGVIGVNWLSNRHDSDAMQFTKQIRMAALFGADTMKGAGRAYKPYQGYIAQRFYPLYRDIYIYNREGRTGLGTGFASFTAGRQGQTIVLKAGLVPATVPVRLIDVKTKL